MHDENAYLLDGISAHAGLFSTAEDFMQICIDFHKSLNSNGILLSKQSAEEMISLQFDDGTNRRGLMWQLPGINKTNNLSYKAFGHTGFTGCFTWNEPSIGGSIVFLSNDIYNGRNHRKLLKYRDGIIDLSLKLLKNEM